MAEALEPAVEGIALGQDAAHDEAQGRRKPEGAGLIETLQPTDKTECKEHHSNHARDEWSQWSSSHLAPTTRKKVSAGLPPS